VDLNLVFNTTKGKQMKINKVIFFFIMVSASSLALATGAHVGGHDSGANSASSANMGHWMAPTTEAAKANPIRVTVGSIQQGEKIYQNNCSSCHGENADGNGMAGMMLKPKPADLRAMAGFHPDGDFAYKIREGRGAMPAWKNVLQDNQVWHLVNYIQTMDSHPVVEQEPSHAHQGGHGMTDTD
jgi:mono/diheme cytochrome c family protein